MRAGGAKCGPRNLIEFVVRLLRRALRSRAYHFVPLTFLKASHLDSWAAVQDYALHHRPLP